MNFGSEPDGSACESDYTITAEQSTGASFAAAAHAVRTAGGPNWIQDVPSPNAPGEWLDNSDPNARLIPLLFVPALIAQDLNPGVLEGAGSGDLCGIAVMPRFMSIDDGNLAYDAEGAAAAIRAGRARWTESFVDAKGVTGSKRGTAIKTLVGSPRPAIASLWTTRQSPAPRTMTGLT